MNDLLAFIIFITVIVAIVALFIFGIPWVDKNACVVLGNDTGRTTRYARGNCFIEIAPGHFVRDYDVVYNLEYVRPIE